jgi:leucyl aminopeptidase
MVGRTEDKAAWERGVALAEGQNFARHLMEAPANKMTPTIFVQLVTERLKGCSVTARYKQFLTDLFSSF